MLNKVFLSACSYIGIQKKNSFYYDLYKNVDPDQTFFRIEHLLGVRLVRSSARSWPDRRPPWRLISHLLQSSRNMFLLRFLIYLFSLYLSLNISSLSRAQSSFSCAIVRYSHSYSISMSYTYFLYIIPLILCKNLLLLQPVALWTGKQLFGLMLSPNRDSGVNANLVTKVSFRCCCCIEYNTSRD